LNQPQRKRELIKRDEQGHLVPVVREVEAFDLETSFLEQEPQHRWLLTTCMAGLAGTVLVSGLALGLFGRNATPVPAYASVQPNTPFFSNTTGDADKQVLAERDLKGGYAYPEIKQGDLPYSKENTRVLDAEIKTVTDDGENITTITRAPPAEPIDETIELAEGSNLVAEMTARGVSKATANALVDAIDQVFPSKQIKTGTKIDVTFDRQIDFYGREVTYPVSVSFDQLGKGTIDVESDEDGQFTAAIGAPSTPQDVTADAAPTVTQIHTSAKVGASLNTAGSDNNVPDYIMAEFTRVFSYDVDFQRQVGPDDTFEVFYGNPLSGSSAKRKVLHMAKLTIGGMTRIFYRFTTADGQTAFFDENGHSASRTLLRTPVSGAHLTSGFGMRRHPLLGYTKMHTGVDFGAPSGTPIHAAGDGEIDQAGRVNGYGNAIIISHSDHLETLYGHMSRFAAGIHDGVHVNQGQVIGYVGSTGRSTGPHLHFEVRIDNKPVNPLAVRATGGSQLAGKDLANFRAQREKLTALMETAPSSGIQLKAAN
jgi:murein DD-endopeptidase MepM/ murein hydrolase activator NlpD